MTDAETIEAARRLFASDTPGDKLARRLLAIAERERAENQPLRNLLSPLRDAVLFARSQLVVLFAQLVVLFAQLVVLFAQLVVLFAQLVVLFAQKVATTGLVKQSLQSASSKPGAVVLDAFGGSGSTAQAALELGRSAISIELDERWCRKQADRVKQRSLF